VRLAVAAVVLLAVAGPCAAEAARLSDDQYTFNGYTMGAPLSEYPTLKFLKRSETEFVKDLSLYENPDAAMTIKSVTFSRARFRFADQRLESIQLTYIGRANRDRLMQWLEGQYGKLTPAERRFINQVEWQGVRMVITLSFNPNTKEGALWVLSPELHHLINEATGSMPD
jgi:hypothetical protein